MYIGNHFFDLEHNSYIMGILNVTPDSFSDGGHFDRVDLALKQAEHMIKDGASIIDIGGESTRPGYREITEEEEISRVLPVIEAIRDEFDIAISLDTYKYKVAEAGIAAGIDMINDIWGLKWDDRLAGLIAKHGVSCCLMHNRAEDYTGNFMEEFCNDMEDTLRIARDAGISYDKIILDPGVGFAKTLEQNLKIINELSIMKRWNLPVLLGTSRKSVIGRVLDLPVTEREEGTIATTVIGRTNGASIFRVHDVRANYRALKMTDAILNIGRKEC